MPVTTKSLKTKAAERAAEKADEHEKEQEAKPEEKPAEQTEEKPPAAPPTESKQFNISVTHWPKWLEEKGRKAPEPAVYEGSSSMAATAKFVTANKLLDGEMAAIRLAVHPA